MKTKNGIYNNLDESVYFYDYLEIRFYFSSTFYLKKFINNLENYINNEIEKLNVKYKVDFETSQVVRLLAKSFYKQIEKRGYRIESSY